VPLFRVPVQIVPRQGLLDPQGTAVAGALKSLGFPEIQDIHIGRFIVVHTEAADANAATSAVQRMCEKLLANPVTEDFVIEEATPA
jgi:phosphoribosylformylglycinamidine synthase